MPCSTFPTRSAPSLQHQQLWCIFHHPTEQKKAIEKALLVEIGPEGGRRHNSPLKAQPSFEGVTAEGPLGDGWKALSLLLPSLSRQLLPSNYFYHYYFLIP
jgi:hypothetical protein